MITIKSNSINYDKYGHCVCCHENMIYKQIIDGREEERASPRLDNAQFLLNDGSKMRVCICRNCLFMLDENDYEGIMDCVYNGWEREVNSFDWDDAKKEDYLNKLRSKSIVRKLVCR